MVVKNGDDLPWYNPYKNHLKEIQDCSVQKRTVSSFSPYLFEARIPSMDDFKIPQPRSICLGNLL